MKLYVKSSTGLKDVVVVNIEPKLNSYARLVPVLVETRGAYGPETFSGWAYGESLREYNDYQIVYEAKDYSDAEDWMYDHKGILVKDLKLELGRNRREGYNNI